MCRGLKGAGAQHWAERIGVNILKLWQPEAVAPPSPAWKKGSLVRPLLRLVDEQHTCGQTCRRGCGVGAWVLERVWMGLDEEADSA